MLFRSFVTEEQSASFSIFKKALEAPFRTMALNAGLSPDVVRLRVEDAQGFEGINFSTGQKEDLKKTGVLDPAKVTRSTVQNATSIASLVLTTEALIAEEPEDEPPMPPGGMGGMEGMM